ncbi:MAG TPA: metallophosphoesterase [Desulfatiglandales bacterium]|nr:metallophosphoesterase [Desulfatiglandales bacterium]
MKPIEFPLLISPNLGCPRIVSLEGLKKGEKIPLILAGLYGEFTSPLRDAFEGVFYLRPYDSLSETALDIPLYPVDDPEEIKDWNLLCAFTSIDETQQILNSELHYNVLGEETRYWRLDVAIREEDTGNFRSLLRKRGRKTLPTLYDLILKDKEGKDERVNCHAIQIVQSTRGGCQFIHLTDIHAAKRNDEILGEVLKVKSGRNRNEIADAYINFNDGLREFIGIANTMADEGELDFVVMTGDLVDFAFHGWEDEPNAAENNWRTFIHLVTGTGAEQGKGNPGLKVAVYTSTGNHDWRLHPYDPNMSSYRDTFGLEKDELEHYEYKSFDSSEYPEDERAKRSKALTSQALKKLNVAALKFKDKQKVRLTKLLYNRITTWVLGGMGVLGGLEGGVRLTWTASKLWVSVLAVLAGAGIGWGIKRVLERLLGKMADVLVDNPLRAEVKALHYYLTHINPFLDYAFQYGDHTFIVMDTGADVFIGKLLDGKQVKHIKRMSLEDNILGGSPDSRAFDSEQIYCNWSQIVWLERVLETVSQIANARSKTLVFLHAPPVNPDKKVEWKNLWESERPEPKWIGEDECNLTYGTINHYLSQFFYLCTGHRESELVNGNTEPSLREVDLVFSGHAHRNIEFRLEKEWVAANKKHEIRIFSDVYSQLWNAGKSSGTWEDCRPVIVQTAGCGLNGRYDDNPPYYRKVNIDDKGHIVDFRVRDREGLVDFKGSVQAQAAILSAKDMK